MRTPAGKPCRLRRPRRSTSSTDYWEGALSDPADIRCLPRLLRPSRRSPLAASGRPATCSMYGRHRLLQRMRRPKPGCWCSCAIPIERFRSGRTLAENRFTVGSTARAAANAAFNRGIYADQLTTACGAAFPREQVLVLQYERCVAEPAAHSCEQTYAVHRPGACDPARNLDRERPRQRVAWSQGHAQRMAGRPAAAAAMRPRTSASQPCCQISTSRLWKQTVDDAQGPGSTSRRS